jgi:hypothetical protein
LYERTSCFSPFNTHSDALADYGSGDNSEGNDGNKGDSDDEGDDNSVDRTDDNQVRRMVEIEVEVVQVPDSYDISFL